MRMDEEKSSKQTSESRSLTTLEEMARQRLNRCGTRLIPHGGGYLIGHWPDLDCFEFRDALRIAGVAQLELIDLNTADVPEPYRIRTTPVRRPGETFRAWEQRALTLRKQQAA